jgi:hypothetical protein
MAKQQTDPITATDLSTFITTKSDFAFELRVLDALHNRGLKCQHGGTYIDPVTEKARQFDIRAHLPIEQYHLYLATECKNLQSHHPLLVHCVPRLENESYHYILQSQHHNPQSGPPQAQLHGKCIPSGPNGIFVKGDLVGKAIDQVGRSSGGDLSGGDRDCYDKWTQAVSSAEALVWEAYNSGANVEDQIMVLAFICPLLVVPDGMLWQVDYSEMGAITAQPHRVSRSNLFLDRAATVTAKYGQYQMQYLISHLMIVTFSDLLPLIDDWADETKSLTRVFPPTELEKVTGIPMRPPSELNRRRRG